jgi:predicted amidohydrolase
MDHVVARLQEPEQRHGDGRHARACQQAGVAALQVRERQFELPQRRANAWATLLRARAIENLCYVVGVNRVGRDGNGASYAGDSVALDFLGQPLSSEGGGDRVETAVLDLESLRAYRQSFPAQLDADPFELLP